MVNSWFRFLMSRTGYSKIPKRHFEFDWPLISTQCFPSSDNLILLQTCSINSTQTRLKSKHVINQTVIFLACLYFLQQKTGTIRSYQWFWFARKNTIHQVLGSFRFQRWGFHLCSFSKHSKNIWLMQFSLQ